MTKNDEALLETLSLHFLKFLAVQKRILKVFGKYDHNETNIKIWQNELTFVEK